MALPEFAFSQTVAPRRPAKFLERGPFGRLCPASHRPWQSSPMNTDGGRCSRRRHRLPEAPSDMQDDWCPRHLVRHAFPRLSCPEV